MVHIYLSLGYTLNFLAKVVSLTYLPRIIIALNMAIQGLFIGKVIEGRHEESFVMQARQRTCTPPASTKQRIYKKDHGLANQSVCISKPLVSNSTYGIDSTQYK